MTSLHYLHTGQRTCHADDGCEVPCEGSGQDASFAVGTPWPEPRFDLRGDEVMDGLTGLIWCRNANLAEFPLTWQEALDFVASMNREQRFGQRDWRLPNRRELRSLLSLQTRLPALPERHPFINVFNGWYWSATTAVISPAHAWYVALNGARMFYGGKDQSFMLWPVRGEGLNVVPRTGQCLCYDTAGKVIACTGSGQDGELRYGAAWPEPRFEIMQTGILDHLTRLLWQRSANLTPQPVVWREALAAVADLNHEVTGNVWRLPTINELEALVDCDAHSPALPSGHPFADVQNIYWSSTTSLFEPDWAWAMYLEKGATGVGQKCFAQFSVWAVASFD
ncbi:MAG: Lcl C-terminal domain-containing protein [Sulfuriferula sp.]